jgi:hypothetical protein
VCHIDGVGFIGVCHIDGVDLIGVCHIDGVGLIGVYHIHRVGFIHIIVYIEWVLYTLAVPGGSRSGQHSSRTGCSSSAPRTPPVECMYR